jgi:hypothetical protein
MERPVDIAPHPEYRSSSVAVPVCASGGAAKSAITFSLEEKSSSQEISDVVSLPVAPIFSTKELTHQQTLLYFRDPSKSLLYCTILSIMVLGSKKSIMVHSFYEFLVFLMYFRDISKSLRIIPF